MQVANIGTGGVLLRWNSEEDVPATVDLFSGDVHVARPHLVRFAPGAAPLLNLVEPDALAKAPELTTQISGQTENAGWGAAVGEDWTVTGEQTPFFHRLDTGDFRVSRFDLTAALGLTAFRPVAGQSYYFSLDMAQHRCGVGLMLEWFDRSGNELTKDEVWRETGPLGGKLAKGYEPLVVSGVCPANAASLRLVLVQGPPTEEPDGYAFYRRPTFTEGDPSMSEVVTLSGTARTKGGSAFAILPIGDFLDGQTGPFHLRSGAARVELPDVEKLERVGSKGAVVVPNGSYLETRLQGVTSNQAMVYAVADGKLLGFFDFPLENGGTQAHIALPPELLDDHQHWIEIRGGYRGETLHAAAHRLNAFITPPGILQEHTSRLDRPGILPLAPARYEGLARTIGRLARTGRSSPELIAQVSAAHDLVVFGPQADRTRFAPLALPAVDQPLFSIVIPVHNKFYFTHFCIASIIYTCAGLDYEVIVVDDGSSDHTLDAASIVENLVVVRHDVAQGFVGACNAGAAAARGDKVVFLNNDTEVVGNWLEELHAPFLLFDQVGMTGAKLIYPDGQLQEAGGIVWNNGRPWNYGRNGNSADPRYGYTRQVDYLSGAALMVTHEVWTAVGGFSKEFAPAYYEDTDLAFKVRRAGYKTVYAAHSVIVHYEGVSNGTETSGSGLKRFQEINRPKFEAKWLASYRQGGPEGRLPDLEKDRGYIGRALVFDYQSPRFDKDAGSFAISQEIRVLQTLGYKVTFVPANFAYLGVYSDALERSGVEHLHAPFYSSYYDVLERRGAEFNLVYIHRHTTAEGIIPLIRQFAPQAKVMLNCADLHFLREMRAARVAGVEKEFETALQTRRRELEVMEQCDAVLTYSDIEKAVIESYLGLNANVRRLPWIVPSGSPRPLSERSGIVFMGSFDHPPNRDAVEFFLEECWPQIREADRDVTFTVIGTGFNRFTPAIEDDRVHILGWVEDASAVLGQARVMVSPLRSGAGIKGKVFDAFVNGTPSVLSAIASEGMQLSGDIAATAATVDEWVRAVLRYLTDDQAWTEASRNGLDYIAQNYSFANAVDIFSRIFASVSLPVAPSYDGRPGEALAPILSLRDIHLMALGSAPAASREETLALTAEPDRSHALRGR